MPVKRICEQCGKEFFLPPSKVKRGSKYCSRKCAGAAQKKVVTLTCPECGIRFTTIPSEHKRGRLYCSKKCYLQAHARIQKSCERCGKAFQSKRRTAKYCSLKCAGNARQGRKASVCEFCGTTFSVPLSATLAGRRYCSKKCSDISKIKNPIEKICPECGERFVCPHTTVGGIGNGFSRTKYCSTRCYQSSRIGEKNHSWKGGKEAYDNRHWNKIHTNPIRYRPISTEELNTILMEE